MHGRGSLRIFNIAEILEDLLKKRSITTALSVFIILFSNEYDSNQ